jgi:hypothetical protein
MYKEIFDAILERKFAGDLRSKSEEIDFILSRYPQNREPRHQKPQNRDD